MKTLAPYIHVRNPSRFTYDSQVYRAAGLLIATSISPGDANSICTLWTKTSNFLANNPYLDRCYQCYCHSPSFLPNLVMKLRNQVNVTYLLRRGWKLLTNRKTILLLLSQTLINSISFTLKSVTISVIKYVITMCLEESPSWRLFENLRNHNIPPY